jgi:uncharacterized linocin/CFP29 family protein
MDHLRRQLAPISDAAWTAIDAEASRSLRHFLAARRLVDFSGPHGWDHSAHNLGRVETVATPGPALRAGLRQVRPLLELRTPLSLAREELDSVDRGNQAPDLQPVIDAARAAALAEDRAVFHGYEGAGITGIAETAPEGSLTLGDDYDRYPMVVAKAVAKLREAGVDGPYGIALGSDHYTGVMETAEHGGYPMLEHIRLILGGPIVWAPALDGGLVVSQRGGDFTLVCGQDFSIGYSTYSDEAVELYLEESLTLDIKEPKAAVLVVQSA